MNVRRSKVFSITMPPEMAKQAERLAQKENRSMSELMREAFRRYQQPVSAVDMREYVRMIAPPDPALSAIREEAKRKGTGKLTMRQIDREIKAARRERSKNASNRPRK
jgi:Arc/MetJ-type ribon-helix-helix transcriptional regulator